MPGRILDLNRADVRLPEVVLLDTGIVITLFLPRLRAKTVRDAANRGRVASLLETMASQGTVTFIAAASFVELIHIVLVARFKADLKLVPDAMTGRPFLTWTALYERRPDLVRDYAAQIEELRLTLDAADVAVLQPDDLGRLPSDRLIEQLLIGLVRRYRVDSGDAAILLEARRAGIDAVVAQDADLRRAARDFDIYTWL